MTTCSHDGLFLFVYFCRRVQQVWARQIFYSLKNKNYDKKRTTDQRGGWYPPGLREGVEGSRNAYQRRNEN